MAASIRRARSAGPARRSRWTAVVGPVDELGDACRRSRLGECAAEFVREGGRIVQAAALVATGVIRDGHREILGLEVVTQEDGAAWLSFLRGLVARGLSGVALVTSDAPVGLREAIAAVLPGAARRRCRTHYADLRIMPTRHRNSRSAAVNVLARSA